MLVLGLAVGQGVDPVGRLVHAVTGTAPRASCCVHRPAAARRSLLVSCSPSPLYRRRWRLASRRSWCRPPSAIVLVQAAQADCSDATERRRRSPIRAATSRPTVVVVGMRRRGWRAPRGGRCSIAVVVVAARHARVGRHVSTTSPTPSAALLLGTAVVCVAALGRPELDRCQPGCDLQITPVVNMGL